MLKIPIFLQIELLPLERSRETSARAFLYSAFNSLRSETAKKDSEEIRQVLNKANNYCNRFLASPETNSNRAPN